ncbi:hypothetical protein F2Q68_00031868 [Brassica cretica]|uniref:Uncharacterized protein n=1 Tax=Brassica cretica TaxID=69181 RepID=A0A8S9GF40_BRACR|nr:hypothetical protein F2Q68_00031868 [Brassica cretica]
MRELVVSVRDECSSRRRESSRFASETRELEPEKRELELRSASERERALGLRRRSRERERARRCVDRERESSEMSEIKRESSEM